MNMYDLIIIGAGPAGMSAALYAARARMKVALIEKEAPGGKLTKTATVENWPGTKRISGVDLALTFFSQINDYDVDFHSDEVVSVNKEEHFTIIGKEGKYQAKNILIATGLVERKLQIPGEDRYYGRGVSYCAVCDGALYADRPVAVIGGGNSALEEALYLTKFASKVYLFHRRDQFRADPIIVEQVKNNNKIELVLNVSPVEIVGQEVVSALSIEHVISKLRHIFKVAAVFPFIGQQPSTEFIKHFGIVDQHGYIVANEDMSTAVPGIYAAGDVRHKTLRQIVTAASDGAIAATTISKNENIRHTS